MMDLKIKSVAQGTAKDVGAMSVDPKALGGKVRSRLVHEACIMYAANKRVGTHKIKTRGEVAGCDRKPWKQKGTGNARAGSKDSPLWRGGGKVFGPAPRDYRTTMPKKARRLATQSALFSKLRDQETIVVDALPESGKTREMAKALKALGFPGRALVVTSDVSPMIVRAIRNIPNISVLPVCDVNAYELLRHKHLVITKDALTKALERFSTAAIIGVEREEE